MTDRIRILLVEDDDDDVVLTREYLDEAFGSRHSFDRVATIPHALEIAAKGEHDIYLVDSRLGGEDGIEFVRKVAKEMGLVTPIILLTGQDDRETDLRAMEAGATDYLVKQNIDAWSLERSIRYSIERKKTEAKIIRLAHEAERATIAKSEFLAAMSHEIRTPMAGVLGMADLLLDTDLSPQQLDWATNIKSSGESLLAILNEILDQSKLDADKLAISPVDFHVRSHIEAIVGLFAPRIASSGLTLDVDLNEALPDGIHADSLRVGQVISNLLSNALKFTETGTITVNVDHETADNDGIMLHVTISDTGIGLSAEVQDQLFKAFSQADSSTSRTYGGTGLGLSISKQLVELMGGEIGVESKVGEGSTFWFTVLCRPATGKVEASDKRHSLDRWLASRVLKVLVAEDNQVNQQLIWAILDNLNHDVTIVGSGKGVVEMMETQNFDIILMDVRMPIMDGLEATRIVRSMDNTDKSDIPIIALTADIAAGSIKEYTDIGMSDVCAKPLDLPVLLKAMNKLLGEEIHTSIPNAIASAKEQQGNDANDDAPEVTSFAQVLERVSNIVDQRREIEGQDAPAPLDVDVDGDLMAKLSAQFVEGVATRCNDIDAALFDLHNGPLNGDARGIVKDTLHILKGQGGSFGYHLVTEIATRAEDIVDGKGTLEPEDVSNLKNYVEAISLVVTKKLSGHGGKVGRILLQGLKDFS